MAITNLELTENWQEVAITTPATLVNNGDWPIYISDTANTPDDKCVILNPHDELYVIDDVTSLQVKSGLGKLQILNNMVKFIY